MRDQMQDFEHKRQDAEKQLHRLLEENPNLEQSMRHSKHRFDQMDPQELDAKMEALTQRKEEMRKHVNVKIDQMYENTQKRFVELQQKKQRCIDNKRAIEEQIETLDVEKNKDLMKTVKEVDRNLSDIFSVLLPGSSAQLRQVFNHEGERKKYTRRGKDAADKENENEDEDPRALNEPEEDILGSKQKQAQAEDHTDVLTGLQLRVSFNGVWKESLTELSGGQRSLLALSLILAMLRYQPSPLYILDEIDSALDLHHTQNIGIMIRKYF